MLRRTFNRRRMLALGAGTLGLGALAASMPSIAAAQDQSLADNLLLMCIDPRFVNNTNIYMQQRGLVNRYSEFAIAGAAAAVVAPHWESWHQTFWDNLDLSIQLHGVDGVIVMDHRDCGAVKAAYGAESISTPERETATHEMILSQFRDQVRQRHPELAVQTYLMALDGSVMTIGA